MTAAMLLAAGVGTRLQPLTKFRPKVLVPVANRPLLDWHLDALGALGIARVALNASHLAEQIAKHVEERKEGFPRVAVVHEETPTGTGGGLLGARKLLESEKRFLVINADIFHAIPLRSVLEEHDKTGADATVVVRRANREEPVDTALSAGKGHMEPVPAMKGSTKGWRFTGIQILGRSVLDHLPSRGSLLDGYQGLSNDGAKIVAYDCGQAMWHDIGTPADYLRANWAAIGALPRGSRSFSGAEIKEPALVDESASVGSACTIGPRAVIGPGASIGAGSRLFDSVVWPETLVLPRASLCRCIAYPGGTLKVPSDS